MAVLVDPDIGQKVAFVIGACRASVSSVICRSWTRRASRSARNASSSSSAVTESVPATGGSSAVTGVAPAVESTAARASAWAARPSSAPFAGPADVGATRLAGWPAGAPSAGVTGAAAGWSAGRTGSGIQNCHPAGANGHAGSGSHPSGGLHPGGGSREQTAAARAAEREAQRAYVEAQIAEAASRTTQAAEIVEEIDEVLAATLAVDDYADLEALKVQADRPPFQSHDATPNPPPAPITPPPEPGMPASGCPAASACTTMRHGAPREAVRARRARNRRPGGVRGRTSPGRPSGRQTRRR